MIFLDTIGLISQFIYYILTCYGSAKIWLPANYNVESIMSETYPSNPQRKAWNITTHVSFGLVFLQKLYTPIINGITLA